MSMFANRRVVSRRVVSGNDQRFDHPVDPPFSGHARRLTGLLTAVAVCLQFSGCATSGGPNIDSDQGGSSTAAAPSQLAPALRCMDGLLLDHGVRDLSVAIDSKTVGSGASAADFNAAVTAVIDDMSRNSRAIRLSATPADNAQKGAVTSRYTLRGGLARNAGVTPQGRTLTIDMTLLTSQDSTVVPGASLRNDISVGSGPAVFTKFGQPFSIAAATSVASGSRALVEISTIELFGKLTKVPYWTCLGVAQSNPAVTSQVQDWYDSMAARPAEIISFFQQDMAQRQLYSGPVDGVPNTAFRESVVAAREVFGQPREPKLTLDFFSAWLSADAATVARAKASIRPAAPNAVAAAPAPAASPAAAVAPPVAAPITPPATTIAAAGPTTASFTPAAAAGPGQPLTLRVNAANEARRFDRGETVRLSILPSREANVYCFLQDEKRQIVRFFPNRFQRESRVTSTEGLQLPGDARFELVMNPRGVLETIACFATDRDVLSALPAALSTRDLSPLPVASLEQLKAAFISASGGELAHESFELRAR